MRVIDPIKFILNKTDPKLVFGPQIGIFPTFSNHFISKFEGNDPNTDKILNFAINLDHRNMFLDRKLDATADP
jgi:hypothetical protein